MIRSVEARTHPTLGTIGGVDQVRYYHRLAGHYIERLEAAIEGRPLPPHRTMKQLNGR